MQIVKATRAEGGVERVERGDQKGQLSREPVMLCQKDDGDHAERERHGLSDLERHGRGEQTVEGEQKVVDGGDVYGKMREQTVALAGDHGQSRFLHVVEHIAEQTEIKVGRGKGLVAQTGDRGDHRAGGGAKQKGDSHDSAAVGVKSAQQVGVGAVAPDEKEAVGDQHGKHKEKFVLAALELQKPAADANRCGGKEKPGVGGKLGDRQSDQRIGDKKECHGQRDPPKSDVLRVFQLVKAKAEHEGQRRKATPRGDQPRDCAVVPHNTAQICRKSLFHVVFLFPNVYQSVTVYYNFSKMSRSI